MRTNSRSRGRGLILAVLTVVVSLPELARAQQTGLFPLAPIRQAAGPVRPGRSDLQDLQASVFRLSSHVLAAVPGRLGMPEPRGPDREKSFKEFPLGDRRRERADRDAAGAEDRDAARGDRPAEAQPSAGARSVRRSMSRTGRATTPAAPRGAAGTARRRRRAIRFELDEPEAAGRTAAAPARPAAAATPPAASNGPELSAPAEQPARSRGSARSRNESRDEATDDRDDDGPRARAARTESCRPSTIRASVRNSAAECSRGNARRRLDLAPAALGSSPRFPERTLQQPGFELDRR